MNTWATTWTAAVLASLAGCSAKAPVPAIQTGAQIYSGNCVACHQQNAKGLPGVYPSLAGSPVVQGDPRQLTLWVVKGQRPASMPPARFSTIMPHFDWLKARDAAALLTFLRSNFGNAAPPIDADSVARAIAE